MRLQFLGDSRDAFKWDLVHWLCTTSSFSKLVFVPLLTPDIKKSRDGLIPHRRFACREFIRPFLDSLKLEPRHLDRVKGLGMVHPTERFDVFVFSPERFVSSGNARQDYWEDFDSASLENAIVFFDPDNGFETRTQKGSKWIRHAELEVLMTHLPESSVVLVYQHKPRRTWTDLFTELAVNLRYVKTAVAVYESTLAFVALAKGPAAGAHISTALSRYVAQHGSVRMVSLVSREVPSEEGDATEAAILGFQLLDQMEEEG